MESGDSMKTLHVDLPNKEYDILIEKGLLDRSGEQIRQVCPRSDKLFVVTDSNVGPLYAARLEASLKKSGFSVHISTVLAGESAKCPENLIFLWEEALEFGLTRTDAVVALGGGVVGDLAGFCAATVLRGVNFVQIPTTLLAQVDSSVGGKVAIDLAHGKNLAGCFWQPKLVIMDPEVLKTLENSTFFDGMAEVIKYGCLFDEDFFHFLFAHPSRKEIMEHIEYVLYQCCDFKRKVVVEDELDTGRRMLLNFGHTLGHAYELMGHYQRYTHGQAVAAGMVMALKLGEKLGVTRDRPGIDPGFSPAESGEEAGADRGKTGVRPGSARAALVTLLDRFHLPTHLPGDGTHYAAAIGLDKKGSGETITLVLLQKMGNGILYPMKKTALLELLKEEG